MSQAFVLSFTEGVTVERASAERTIIHMPPAGREHTFIALSPGLSQAIDTLSSTGATEDELARLVEKSDGPSALARFYYYLLTFAEHRILVYSVTCQGRRLATLTPVSTWFRFSPAPVDPQSRYMLSRFAYLHREEDYLVLESPLAHGKITLYGWNVAVVAELAKGQTLDSMCCLLPSVPLDSMTLLFAMLLGACFVFALNSGEPYPGENEVLAQWDFHDLLFHARSRVGRHGNPFGGTYRFRDKIKPLPAVKEFVAEESINLYRPNMKALEQQDSPFTVVLEARRSIRQYDERPITDRQLGEFLYRSARVKELRKTELQDLSMRPYPGGGAIYELELYLSVACCENIPPGLYHYCPKEHRLEKICGPTDAVDALLRDAAYSAGFTEMPQVLITIAARFQRLSWKYESMAYSLLLKDVGGLYQTMYLVATAMDLAPCAIGGGDSDLFAQAVGLDYYAETSVGEFLLGSKRLLKDDEEHVEWLEAQVHQMKELGYERASKSMSRKSREDVHAHLAIFTTGMTFVYWGLAVLGWGGFSAFFFNPARMTLTILLFVIAGVALFSGGNLSPGEREDRSNRWVVVAFAAFGLLSAYLPAYTDRKDFWTFDGDTIRWLGVMLFAIGGTLRIWPVFVLGRRFSGLVAIQPGHTLVTTGIYGTIRHPSYLGLLVNSLGWALSFRAGVGLLLTALFIPPLLARIRSEENLLRTQFGAEHEAYCSRTWRLIPGFY